MHEQFSPKMNEEDFWRNYFFRVKYIRLALGIEKAGANNSYVIIRSLREEDVLYKPTFEPPPKIKSTTQKEAPSTPTFNQSPLSKSSSVSSPSANTKTVNESSNSTLEDAEDVEERDRQSILEARRMAEAALAAEVEAELDDDDIDLTDLGDLDLGDVDDNGNDTDDFDDLGDLEDDEELEAQIALELAQEEEKKN